MKGIVVSNTGPLIALALIGRLDVLRLLFDEILVPLPVHEEILEGGAAGVGVADYAHASWVSRRTLRNPLDPLVRSILDKGEASVIQLALEEQADWVLIDERKGRRIARDIYRLNVIGSAGVIVEAKRQGFVTCVGDTLSRMKEAGYWIHADIVAAAMTAAGEK
ncbi:MAG: DUF3368 domain-containing protein [Pseudomonadota bacterium]